MPVVNAEKLITLQRNPDNIRNDHGKTSLTDALIATNGIISPKLAGKIRYLDSRPDEQLRGITMESSAISLFFSMLRRASPSPSPSLSSSSRSLSTLEGPTLAAPVQKDFLINLIDSPGHIDFSSEVSTASRLCDGALVLVDAVEGVCSQTVTVLRQTWVERLKPLLVINKIDRLISELKMSSSEAYVHLSKLLEQVNAVIGGFFQGERMEEDLAWREKVEERVAKRAEREKGEVDEGDGGQFEEKDDEDLYFAPEKNNVVFSSAVDGWAFTVRQFAGLYERKLGMKRAVLEKVLWGDFYLEPKTTRVLGAKHLKGRALKPMFVQLVLDNVWAVYEATTGGSKGRGDPTMVEKITQSLSLTIPPHILRSRDPRALLIAVFSAWLPLSTAVLVSVVEYLPSPPAAQFSRLPVLLDASPGSGQISQTIRDAMVNFRTSKNYPVIAYISKMVAVRSSELPQNKRKEGATLTADEARDLARRKRAEITQANRLTAESETNDIKGVAEALDGTNLEDDELQEQVPEDPEHLIGFARLYSGTLSVGDSVYVLPPKFTPATPHAAPKPQQVVVTGLYLMMGRGLESLVSVPAGCVFGIAGLEGHILKSGTLSSQLEGSVSLAGVSMGAQPIVRVALEPINPSDLDQMINGMRLLEQSDPCAQYEVLESGEHVILTAGELHLERCLKDLRERFARCEIQAGEPIVPYRESIISAAEMAAPREKELPRGTVVGVTTSKQLTVRLKVRPLPTEVTEFLEKNVDAIRKLYAERKARDEGRQTSGIADMELADHGDPDQAFPKTNLLSLAKFRTKLNDTFAQATPHSDIWANVVEEIAAFGPRRVGPNLLIDKTRSGACQKFLQEIDDSHLKEDDAAPSSLSPRNFSDNISYAFQLATAQGPLCHEPVQGVAVFLEDVTIAAPSDETHTTNEQLGRLTGETIKTVRDSIRQGFLDWSPRLLLAMYSCEIQASTEVLGRVYAVITRRRGRIVSESLKEGTPFFTVLSVLPVAESFGFSDEIRKRTSGAASPQLVFHGFEMLDEDPFWVPFTEDELEDLGELADRENVAKRYMDGVRVRKGLAVRGRKLVRDAEKQKTLKR
ncbi:MAG: hypothetical protein LQ342_006869 [Letrouitia transgressa]|nr:MAG: hypothetical protein LQ342_006869 [Letrouitia transgressa]